MMAEDEVKVLNKKRAELRYKKLKAGHKLTCASLIYVNDTDEWKCDCGRDKEYAESLLGLP